MREKTERLELTERESMKIPLFRHGALTQLSLLLLLFLAGCVRRSLGDEENCKYTVEITSSDGASTSVTYAYVTECNSNNYRDDMCSGNKNMEGEDMPSCLCNNVLNNGLPTYYVCTSDCGTWTNGVKSKDVDGQCVQ